MGVYGNEAIEKAAEKAAQEAKKRGKFLSLEHDGDRAIVVFLPNPQNPKDAYIYASETVGFGKKEEEFDPRKHKESDKKFKVVWGVYVVKAGSCPKKHDGTADRSRPEAIQWSDVGRIQKLSGGIQKYQTWNNMAKKFGIGWFVEIERHGIKDDNKTTYTFDRLDASMVIPGSTATTIPPEYLNEILKMDYPKLDVSGEDDADAGGNGSPPPQPPADSPITDEVANDIMTHVKSMVNDPGSGRAFVAHFGCKIRELPRSRQAEATAWISALLSVKDQITPTTDDKATLALVQGALARTATGAAKDPFAVAQGGATAESDY